MGFTFVRGFSSLPLGHHGVDLAAPTGTPIHAVAGGVVSYARDERSDPNAPWESRGGGLVVHVNVGGSAAFVQQYAHMHSIGVSAGQTIAAGTVVGTVDTTGDATGPHLHFAIFTVRPSSWYDPLATYPLPTLIAAVSGSYTVPTGGGSTTPPADVLSGFLATIGRSLTDPIRAQDVGPFVAYLASHTDLLAGSPILDLFPGLPGSTIFNRIAVTGAVEHDVGDPWSKIGKDLLGQAVVAGNVIPDALAGVLGPFLAGIPGLLVNLGILVLVVVLAYRGIQALVEPEP